MTGIVRSVPRSELLLHNRRIVSYDLILRNNATMLASRTVAIVFGLQLALCLAGLAAPLIECRIFSTLPGGRIRFVDSPTYNGLLDPLAKLLVILLLYYFVAVVLAV